MAGAVVRWSAGVRNCSFQPALVRYNGFYLFTVGDRNNILSSKFIQS